MSPLSKVEQPRRSSDLLTDQDRALTTAFYASRRSLINSAPQRAMPLEGQVNWHMAHGR